MTDEAETSSLPSHLIKSHLINHSDAIREALNDAQRYHFRSQDADLARPHDNRHLADCRFIPDGAQQQNTQHVTGNDGSRSQDKPEGVPSSKM